MGGYYAPYGTTERPRPVPTDELLDVVGLTELADQRIATFSGGQRRRLDVAMGIVGRPELLFLDEPTAGFDPQARREFHDLVHRLTDLEGTTILLTTHDLDEAEKLADRVLILAGGRIVADDTAERLALRAADRRRGQVVARRGAVRARDARTPPPSSASCSTSTAMPSSTSRYAGPASRTPTSPWCRATSRAGRTRRRAPSRR